ncbi:hypothetical protein METBISCDRAFT_26154 [Metschnikowia bicuspidata]|uniref:Uncharacterized protein n=1 Tax=Metschnikowia bicuspidata TaxID=27322 RepID=A0A4P9ZG35_9ASCO|nr:hypothetical protein METBISCDRAFT_26154 [Metschnikowia bicuspidata]
MKRSASTSADTSDLDRPLKWRLVRVFSALKDAFTTKRAPPFSDLRNPSRKDKDEQYPALPVPRQRDGSANQFSGHDSASVPRGSLIGPRALESETELREGDAMLCSNDSVIIRHTSPGIFAPKNQILPMNPLDMELDQNLGSPDFAPLYTDENGILVRPPFINFDPRERYQMLKLKKSVEASELLRNSMKHMVDPDETISISRPNNKVDCLTQTHNKNYLDLTLHFIALRKKLALRNRKQRSLANTRRLFSGSFAYDPVETKVPNDRNTKLKGYLGDLSKPEFGTKTLFSGQKPLPDQETEPELKLSKSVDDRIGLHDALRAGKVVSDIAKRDANKISPIIADFIHVKETPLPAIKPSTGPSSGFKFNIDQSVITSSIKDVPDAAAPTGQKTEPQSQTSLSGTLFSSKPAETLSQPLGTLVSLTSPDLDDETLAGFGPLSETTAKKYEESKPLFAASSTDKNTRPVSTPAEETKSTPSLSGFRKGDKAFSDTTKKALGFTLGASASDASSTSLFGAGGNSAGTPLFGAKSSESKPLDSKSVLFGENKLQAQNTPSFLFGESESNPLLSFGKPAELKDAANNDSKKDAASFSFSSVPSSPGKPLFSNSEEAGTKRAFTFGESKDGDPAKKTGSSALFALSAPSTLAFNLTSANAFGKMAENTQGTQTIAEKSVTSIPQSENPAKFAFSFGSSAPADPATIFGSGNNAPAPMFNFSLNKEVTLAPVPNFSQPAAQKQGGFSFSSRALSGFESSSIPPVSGFTFGSQNNLPSISMPAVNTAPNTGGFSGFGNSSSANSALEGSRSATPAEISGLGFSTHQQQGLLHPFGCEGTPQQSSFRQGQPSGFGNPAQPIPGNQSGFAFGNNAVGSPFGGNENGFAPGSRESTPSSQPAFTPPIANISNRKIAQMRRRKRF